MMSSDTMYRLENDAPMVASVAHTVSLAFADDPLIKWLRPNATPWSSLTHEICKWQQRRIQTAILDGYVFYRASGANYHDGRSGRLPPKSEMAIKETERSLVAAESEEEENTSAAIILFPPSKQLKWSLRRVILACKLWWLNLVDSASDSGTCIPRLEHLLTAHDNSLAKLETQYGIENLWYLEVLAVHPSLQSRGIGGKSMRWLLEYLGDQSIALECTAQSNIAFYEKFGFRTVEEVTLTDEQSMTEPNSTLYWVMLRDRKGIAKSSDA